MNGEPLSNRATRTSRATGESVRIIDTYNLAGDCISIFTLRN